MNFTVFRIPYGKTKLKISLPKNRPLGVLENEPVRRKNIKSLITESFAQVSNISKILNTAKRTLIVVPDHTRSAHLKEVLPHLLRKIPSNRSDVDIIVSTGLHKRPTVPQLKSMFGERIFKRYRIICHSQAEKSLAKYGYTKRGIPIVLNKILKKYERLISVGVIEPHLYAGYSGGAKTIAIGLAGEETISATHSAYFLNDPLTKIGSVRMNPFQESLWEIVDKIAVAFSVNIVNDPHGRLIKIFSGKLKDVFENGVNYAKKIFEVNARVPADIVICGIGYPKDMNLYQASRAINYIANDRPVLRKGGVIIVVCELKEGLGFGLSEKRFISELKKMRSPEDFVDDMLKKGFKAGEHRSFMVARAMLDYNIVFVSRGCKNFMAGLPLNYFENVDKALDYADGIVGGEAKIYVVPHALSTIPKLEA